MSSRSMTLGEKEEIRAAFQLFDPEGTGNVKVQDIRDALEGDGYERSQRILKKLSIDRAKSTMNLEEFTELLTSRDDDDGLSDMERMFLLFDTEKKGFISLDDLQRIANELGESMSMEELQEMIGQNGKVDLEEFIQIMNKKLWA